MMKKSLLFVIDSLSCGGAEKSLITLLSLLDYSKFSVDLMLFGHGGELEKLVPKKVNILKPIKFISYSNLTLINALKFSLLENRYRLLYSRIKYSTSIRIKKLDNTEKARVFWESVSSVVEENPKKYDVAISYAQGVPTYYVADKVKAGKKIAWINVSYKLNETEKDYQRKFYNEYYKIISVSETAKDILLGTFPEYSKKIDMIYDITNPEIITKMADVGESYEDDFDGIRILTIGRIDYLKGYDIALESCKKLKEKGINFRWYALGKGPLKKQIQKNIMENDLSDHFILLGVKDNPYSYIKDSDIYVQTSRTEGFGLAIAEARILNIPVVTTNFDTVYNQMKNYKNGLVVEMNSNSVVDGIITLLENNILRESIIHYLKNEKKGNLEELNKFYKLIG